MSFSFFSAPVASCAEASISNAACCGRLLRDFWGGAHFVLKPRQQNDSAFFASGIYSGSFSSARRFSECDLRSLTALKLAVFRRFASPIPSSSWRS